MSSIVDDRGFNQGFRSTRALGMRTRRRSQYMIQKAQVPAGGRILEMGCGTGEMAYYLAEDSQAEVLGVDLCVPFIEEARSHFKHPQLSYENFDLNQNLAEKREIGKFDAVVGNGILHHLYFRLDEALAQIKSLCKPGARIVFLEPNLINPYCFLIFSFAPLRKMAKLEPDEMAFTKKWIIQKLERSGFSQISVEYKDFLLPNTPEVLIEPVIKLGGFIEKLPLLRAMSQSLFISAQV